MVHHTTGYSAIIIVKSLIKKEETYNRLKYLTEKKICSINKLALFSLLGNHRCSNTSYTETWPFRNKGKKFHPSHCLSQEATEEMKLESAFHFHFLVMPQGCSKFQNWGFRNEITKDKHSAGLTKARGINSEILSN
jgi:hypothetical protein